jgi:hypothetical protein
VGFHRLTAPTYPGGLPGGYDYINNAAGPGTPVPADAALGGGAEVGSYFFGSSEQVTTAALNRGIKAVAQNTDYLDDLFHRELAVPKKVEDTAVGPIGSVILTGPGILLGDIGHPNTVAGLKELYLITDTSGNPILNAGVPCVVTAIDDTVGNGFSAGNVTLTVVPDIPDTTVYQVHYGQSSNYADFPIDALTRDRVVSDSTAFRGAGGAALIGYNGGPAWADATTNPATSVEAQLDKIVTDLAAVTGSQKIGGDALAGSPYAIGADTVGNQLSAILASLNALAGASPAAVTAIDEPGLRLTLTTAVPVTSSDVTTTSVIYYTPWKTGRIHTYDAGSWTAHVTPEVSLDISALGLANNSNYDIFAYWDGAAIQLELSAAWASNTARADALVRQDGILVKAADPSRRYVGTFRTISTTTTCDTKLKRFLWNFYNRVRRTMAKIESTSSWTYGTTSWRVARADANNGVEFVCGEPTNMQARVRTVGSGASTGYSCSVGIGLDSTTVNSSTSFGSFANSSLYSDCEAIYNDYPSIGYHKVYWLEISSGVTITFYGTVSIYSSFGLTAELDG